MKVVLNVDRKYKKFLSQSTFPIVQAQSILNELEQKAQTSQKVFPVELLLIDSSDEGIFRDRVVFGNQESKNIVFLVQRSLDTTFSDLPNQEKEELLLQIEQELTKTELDFTENKENSPKVEKKKKEKKQEINKSKKKRSFHLNKKLLVGLVSLFSLLFVAYAVISFANTPKEKEPTLQEYLSNQEFLKAGKAYPDELAAIENELFMLTRQKDKSYLKQLEEFNQAYPTKQGSFDLAMFAFDYEEAMILYEKAPSAFENDEIRLALIGYAFLKMDKVEDAKKILSKAKNAELEKYVRQYEQLLLIVQEKEKEISELQKKPSENKEKIEKSINELYEAKEKISQF